MLLSYRSAKVFSLENFPLYGIYPISTYLEYLCECLKSVALLCAVVVCGELDLRAPLSSPVLVVLEHWEEHAMETLHADVPQLLDHKLRYYQLAGVSNRASPVCAREGGERERKRERERERGREGECDKS